MIRQLGEIRDAGRGWEAQIAQIAKNQRQLTTSLLSALKETQASAFKAHQAEPQTAAAVPDMPSSDSLEIEALGASGKELDAIVSWIQDIKSERPTSVILIEPVMPHEGADLDGQRKRLMNEAGRVWITPSMR